MAVSTIKMDNHIPSWEYVGLVNQIHWSQWECPSDGFVIFDFGLLTSGSIWYYYINDTTLDFPIGKATGTTCNGTSQTIYFPVQAGHIYKMGANTGVNGSQLNFRYFKFVQ